MVVVAAVACLVLPLLFLFLTVTHQYRRRPSSSSPAVQLPPGSDGFPLIGETLQLFRPGKNFDVTPFFKARIQRYGPIFRTKLFGKRVVVSADSDLNHFLLQQEGKLIETLDTGTSARLFFDITVSSVHKYVRSATMRNFGVQAIKDKLLPEIEQLIHVALHDWSTRPSVEVKYASGAMALNHGASLLFGYDPQQSEVKLIDLYSSVIKNLVSIPLNLPGTTHYKCLKDKEKAVNVITKELKKRRSLSSISTEGSKGDFLDHAIQEMNNGNNSLPLTEDLIVNVIFAIEFVNHESISTILTLAVMLIEDHPLVLQELVAEHEAILKERNNNGHVGISWTEYKSMMTFTHQVVNEVLRLGNIAPGLLRRSLKDIQFNGYTIPAGYGILIATSAMHLNSETYEDPSTFNPWRWNEVRSSDKMYKDFMPFGWGMKQCAGSEYGRLFVTTFLHILVTKYTWKRIKGGELRRNPLLNFGQGLHVKLMEKKK